MTFNCKFSLSLSRSHFVFAYKHALNTTNIKHTYYSCSFVAFFFTVEGHTDIKIFSKQLPGNSVNVVKTYGTLPASPKVRFSFLSLSLFTTKQSFTYLYFIQSFSIICVRCQKAAFDILRTFDLQAQQKYDQDLIAFQTLKGNHTDFD